MAQMVKKTVYENTAKDVLLNPQNAFTLGVQIGNTGVTTNAEGRKIIPAGTPVGNTVSALETRNTVLTVTNSSATGANAQGILLYEVDVTDGNANGTIIVRGEVDSSKCPTLDATVKTALAHIIFVNGGTN